MAARRFYPESLDKEDDDTGNYGCLAMCHFNCHVGAGALMGGQVSFRLDSRALPSRRGLMRKLISQRLYFVNPNYAAI